MDEHGPPRGGARLKPGQTGAGRPPPVRSRLLRFFFGRGHFQAESQPRSRDGSVPPAETATPGPRSDEIRHAPHPLRLFCGPHTTHRRVRDVTTHRVASHDLTPTSRCRTTRAPQHEPRNESGFPAARRTASCAPRRPLTRAARFFTTGLLPYPLGLHPSDPPVRRGARSGGHRGWVGVEAPRYGSPRVGMGRVKGPAEGPGASPRAARGRRACFCRSRRVDIS